ncbi:spermidine synthase [Flavobacterium suaedae]|uniref:Spermidine synthase n=1 Tax=Flavobacterium suaedae TaxID=1767027 RepID=A0ABQ1JE79_9FLAO|nr:fused MFS/spermidine synthase [Flavobacterium suaedae]GGB66624.1 spermidine synthase [Flavobacterium suaedae]
MLKKFLSYLIPIKIYTKTSEISRTLEVTLSNGELVLDSKNTNYSYGSLQRILRKGLQYIGFEKIKTFESILLLGVAGGSVIKTLKEEINYKGKITGVELDPEIIEIANNYFNLDKTEGVTVIIDDAKKFVANTNEKYDFIIIDIFQDKSMPEFLFESDFTENIKSIVNNKGYILFNTMVLNRKDKERNKAYTELFDNSFQVDSYPGLENYNEIFIIQKLK